MAISICRVEGSDLPAYFQTSEGTFAFKVISFDGAVFFLGTDEQAANVASKLHRLERLIDAEDANLSDP